MSLFILIFTVAILILLLTIAAGVFYSIVFPRQPHKSPLPPITDSQLAAARRLEHHVQAVASVPHNIAYYPALESAACYIEDTLSAMGLSVICHVFRADGRDVRNLEVVFEPEDLGDNTPTYIVGAHYDSAEHSPGANDNGTGVAALLELAEQLRDFKPATARLRLVFFVNEEWPYGKTPLMGSWRHASALKDAGEPVAGMIALETLGYFSNQPGSQHFPWPFGWIYSDVGNFVAFVGLPGSRSFLRRALKLFRARTSFASIGGVAPGFLEGIDLSDHWAYHQFGFPALMVTDTAPFRNPHYHSANDLPETVDYQSLARITQGLERMVCGLVGSNYSLTHKQDLRAA